MEPNRSSTSLVMQNLTQASEIDIFEMDGQCMAGDMVTSGESAGAVVTMDESPGENYRQSVDEAGNVVALMADGDAAMIETTESDNTTLVPSRKSGGTIVVTTNEAGDTILVPTSEGGDAMVFATSSPVKQPLLQPLDLTLPNPDEMEDGVSEDAVEEGRVDEGPVSTSETGNDGNNERTDDQHQVAEGDEIIFICMHGQTFRCKPQAGTVAITPCACNKPKKLPQEDVQGDVQKDASKRRTRNQKFTCKKCGGRFTQKASLARHMTAHANDDGEGVGDKAEAHTDKTEAASKKSTGPPSRKTKTQPRPRNKVCEVCGKAFSRCRDFERHKKRHQENGKRRKTPASKPKEYKCTICEMVLANRYKLQRHREEHISSQPPGSLSCKVCSKTFVRPLNLKRHEKSHEKSHEKKHQVTKLPKPFACQDCPKKFTRKVHLTRHEHLHVKETGKVFSCTFCPQTFEDRFSYKKHHKTHIVKKYYREMTCEVCQKVVKGPITLKRHMRTHTKEKPFPCRIGCGAYFSSTSYRTSHEQYHCTAGPNLLCPFCGKVFENKARLITHETREHRDGVDEEGSARKRHTYPCRHCGRVFRFSAVRSRHERIHTNEKPYMCQYCPKAFCHANSLLCHERVHTKERPYKCTVCGKAFSQTTHLTTHMRVHTKEKPYECRYCKQAFAHLGTRKSHERTHKEALDLKDVPSLQGVTYQSVDETPAIGEDGMQADIATGNPEGTYQDMADSGLQETDHRELPVGDPGDIPDSDMQDVTHRIILSHPEHEVQAADVIMQLLQSGNRMANFDGLVHIVQSQQ